VALSEQGQQGDQAYAALRTERARGAYRELRERVAGLVSAARQRTVLSDAGQDLRPAEVMDVECALANMEWDWERDAIEAAMRIEHDELRMQSEVAATGMLTQHEIDGDEG
jgi:hypothetical protein